MNHLKEITFSNIISTDDDITAPYLIRYVLTKSTRNAITIGRKMIKQFPEFDVLPLVIWENQIQFFADADGQVTYDGDLEYLRLEIHEDTIKISADYKNTDQGFYSSVTL